MTTFDDRERGFESKFVLDSEQQFRAEARRNHLLGVWAGNLLGKSGQELEDYAMELVKLEVKAPGTEDIVNRVAGDLAGKVTPDEVRSRLGDFMRIAKSQIQNDI